MNEHRPPATRREVAHLVYRLRIEVGLTNALGIGVLAVAFFVLQPPAREHIHGIPWLLGAVIIGPIYALGVYVSHAIFRPLQRWLQDGVAEQPAPDRIQRLVLLHPTLQALTLFALWFATAIGLSVTEAWRAPDEPLRGFLSTFAGVAVAGITVATLTFLADQRVLGPWYDRFFAGADPTAQAIPSTRVGRRMLVAFALGAAVPMLLIGFSVSDQLFTARDLAHVETVVWFLVAVGVATGLVLTLSVRVSITRPLGHLRAAAERVREGDLSVAVPVESPDELGELAVAFNSMVEGLRERRRVQDLFGRQVGDAVADKVLTEGVDLRGERRVASVLFLDLEGFSALSERRPPEEVVALLNRVFTVVIREVDARDGLVNKFMGDAVLAVFGAPVDDTDHAHHAIAAARAIGRGLSTEGVRFGIGVSTGPVVAAHVGAEERFEYTVVGDAVNEAARLQELTRDRTEKVLVSGRTIEQMGKRDGTVLLGSEVLRGRNTPVDVYALT